MGTRIKNGVPLLYDASHRIDGLGQKVSYWKNKKRCLGNWNENIPKRRRETEMNTIENYFREVYGQVESQNLFANAN